jgi:membrane protein
VKHPKFRWVSPGGTWLWISNIAVLFGAELNAELERGRQIEGGHPPDREPFLEPRDTRKMENSS